MCCADNNRLQVFHSLEALLYCLTWEPDRLWPLIGYPHVTTFLLIGWEQNSARYMVLAVANCWRLCSARTWRREISRRVVGALIGKLGVPIQTSIVQSSLSDAYDICQNTGLTSDNPRVLPLIYSQEYKVGLSFFLTLRNICYRFYMKFSMLNTSIGLLKMSSLYNGFWFYVTVTKYSLFSSL